MRLVGYPDLVCAAAEHEAFASRIARLDLQRELEGDSADLVLRLDQEVGGWLRDHIHGSVAALARFVQAGGWAGHLPLVPGETTDRRSRLP